MGNEAKPHVYNTELSAVVSKYIGETEKNLRKLSGEAESGSAVLFFDEADAPFGRRRQVKDGKDRYANSDSLLVTRHGEV